MMNIIKKIILALKNKNSEYSIEKRRQPEEHYKNNRLHNEQGPAIIWNDGSKEWYQNGKKHREDGPAIEMITGEKHWYKNDLRHRDGGPASTYPDGNGERWYYENKLHRLDGPAVCLKNGEIKEYWVNGIQMDEDMFYLSEKIQEKNKEVVKKKTLRPKI